MKKLLLPFLFFFVFATAGLAQVPPKGISYQAVARDNSGHALANTDVSFRISILYGSATGAMQYSETHQVTTDAFGAVNMVIGRGKLVSGNFWTINWRLGSFFVQVEMDAEGKGEYLLMGASEMLTVPYAFYAGSSGPTYNVGDKAEGGIVIATWDEGRHGWVAALEDESKEINWVNAEMIVQAKTSGGYRDWAIPNTAQLKVMYELRELIGEFTSVAYWSSNSSSEFSTYVDFLAFKTFYYDDAGREILAGEVEYAKKLEPKASVGIRAIRVF